MFSVLLHSEDIIASTLSDRPMKGNLRRAAACDCPIIDVISVCREECFLESS